MEALSSTYVRKNWSETIEKSIRKQPVFIKRSRDLLILAETIHIEKLLEDYNLYITIENLSSSSYGAYIGAFDIYEKGNSVKEVADQAVGRLVKTCLEYYENLNTNINMPDRAKLYPYVLKVLLVLIKEEDPKDILIIKS